jgi:hypothetical protein
LEKTIIKYDEARGAVALGALREQAEEERIAEDIVTFLGTHKGKRFAEPELLKKVTGGRADKRSAVRNLYKGATLFGLEKVGKETRICILRRQRNLRRSETQQQVNQKVSFKLDGLYV